MTQNTEQKVRTRDEQISGLAESLWDDRPYGPAYEFATEVIDEAMRLGAAEQRRKDAEGQEPVAWIFKIRVMGTDAWIEHTSTTKVDPIPGMRRDILPLYTHPANVTAMDKKG